MAVVVVRADAGSARHPGPGGRAAAARPASALPWWATLRTSTGGGVERGALVLGVAGEERVVAAASAGAASVTSPFGSAPGTEPSRWPENVEATALRARPGRPRPDGRPGPRSPAPPPRAAARGRRVASRSTSTRVEHVEEAAGVVELVVGDDDRGERIDPAARKRSGDARAGRAAVDQDRRRPRRLEQDRVALADVERGRSAAIRAAAALSRAIPARPAPGRPSRRSAPPTAITTRAWGSLRPSRRCDAEPARCPAASRQT